MDEVVLVCSDCMNERRVRTQKSIDEKISRLLKDKVKKIWFKIGLKSGDLTEHVWIDVIDINIEDRIFIGKIDNDICMVGDKYNYGDQVIIGFGEIEEILTG